MVKTDSMKGSEAQNQFLNVMQIVWNSLLWLFVGMVIITGPFVVFDLSAFVVGGWNGFETYSQIPVFDAAYEFLYPLIFVSWLVGIGWEVKKHHFGGDTPNSNVGTRLRPIDVVVGLMVWAGLGAVGMVVLTFRWV